MGKQRSSVTVDGVVTNYLAEATFWRTASAILDTLAKQLRVRRGPQREVWEGAWETLRMAAIREERDAMHNAFMFALSLPDDKRDEIRQMAYDRFLSAGKSVMNHLNPAQGHPGQWDGAVETEFREFLAAHFQPVSALDYEDV